MIRALWAVLALLSLLFFPWQYTLLIVLAATPYEPFIPLAIGLLADTLYYVPSLGVWPWATIGGAALTAGALFVRSRLRTGIIR